ncbi:MAG: ankyrin repeat domain-containing protein [Alphaproteobacteria bacterium]|nr:ankyrin repeat domain-containing protein [Alphaproteobacteria bacterium]
MQYAGFAPDAQVEAAVASVVRGLYTSQPYVIAAAPPALAAIPKDASDAQVARALFDAPELAAFHFTLLGAAETDCAALFALGIARAGGLAGAGSRLDGRTLPPEWFLVRAALHGSAAVVRLLLEAGVDPNWVDVDGQNDHTALHWAVYSGHTQAVAALVAAPGIDLMALDKRRSTPLACAMGFVGSACAPQLLAAGASPHDAGPGVSIPLVLAAQVGNADLVQQLLDAGADPNVIDKKSGITPLQQGIVRGSIQVIERLQAAGADPDIPSSKKFKKSGYDMARGSTAFDFAALSRHRVIVEAFAR